MRSPWQPSVLKTSTAECVCERGKMSWDLTGASAGTNHSHFTLSWFHLRTKGVLCRMMAWTTSFIQTHTNTTNTYTYTHMCMNFPLWHKHTDENHSHAHRHAQLWISVTKQTVTAGCCMLPVLPTRALSEGLASVFLIHVLSQLGDSSGKCIAAKKEEWKKCRR